MMRALVLLIGLVMTATESAAQTIPSQSFEDLQKLLKPGQQIVVRDQDGRKQSGRFVSMTGQDFVLDVQRWLRRPQRRSVAEGDVSRVDVRDSALNGVLIGAGIGAALAAYGAAHCDDCDSSVVMFGMGVYISAGAAIGEVVDRFVNQTVYASPQTRRVQLEPLVGFSRAGVAARIRF
jgi:hypothetical protein